MRQEAQSLPGLNLHQRSESDVSHNYSVLDCYDSDTVGLTEIGSGSSAEVQIPHFHESYLPLLGALAQSVHEDPHGNSIDDMSQNNMHLTYTNPNISQDTAHESNKSNLTLSGNRTLNGTHTPIIQQLTEKALRKSLEDRFDIYGFRKESPLFNSTFDSYNSWFKEYIPQYVTQKKKWLVQLKQNGLGNNYDTAPSRFPPKSEKIKKLVRRGIPPEWRGQAWFFYAGGYDKLNKNVGVYEKIVVDTMGITNKDTEVIERDLYRTFPDNKFFKLELKTENGLPEPPMISSLRRVLVAFAQYKPQIGYCQSLNFLVGLLLIFMLEERAFWMLVIITERIIPHVHSTNLEGVHTDQGVLMICIHEYIPKLWSIIGKSFDGIVLKDDNILTRPPPLTLVTSAWFMSMFVGILPIECVLRFWDIIFYEGSKTLFRLSLTICRLSMEHPNFCGKRESRNSEEKETDRIEIFQFIQNFPKSITDPNLLINLCYKKIGGYGYGFLSQDEINRCREFVAQQRMRFLNKKNSIASVDLSDLERAALHGSTLNVEDQIHDVYGFQKLIMSGVAWNMHISSVMKRKLSKRSD